jgi:hypothetical protein
MTNRPQGAADYEADKARGLTYSYEQDKRNINWGSYEEDKAKRMTQLVKNFTNEDLWSKAEYEGIEYILEEYEPDDDLE